MLSEEEQQTLGSWLHAGTGEQRMVERVRIILAAAEGTGTNEIARDPGTRAARVSDWRTRLAHDRLRGLRRAFGADWHRIDVAPDHGH